jgi:hypothetical protein
MSPTVRDPAADRMRSRQRLDEWQRARAADRALGSGSSAKSNSVRISARTCVVTSISS